MQCLLGRLPAPKSSRWFQFLRHQRRLSTSNENKQWILRDLAKPRPEISPRWLYDDRGSDLFERITSTQEYYLTRKEIEVLTQSAADMALFPDEFQRDDDAIRRTRRVVVEMGAGSGRKTSLLLDAMANLVPNDSSNDTPRVSYVPIDVSAAALEQNVKEHNLNSRVCVHPRVCTYQECIPEMSRFPGRKTYLFLGSSLGNYDNIEANRLLSDVALNMSPRDRFIVGVDTPHGTHKSSQVIEKAYNDDQGLTSEFILNALSHVNREAGTNFDKNAFRHVSTYDQGEKAVLTYLESRQKQTVTTTVSAPPHAAPVITLQKNDRIFVEHSRKFSLQMMHEMGALAGLTLTRHWHSDDGGYYLVVEFIRNFSGELWSISDFIFDDLVDERLGGGLTRPIQLRHPFVFYKGHIPSFYHLKCDSETRNDKETDASNAHHAMARLFERGMDPDVINPSKCHDHSAGVDHQNWPKDADVRAFQRDVRGRIKAGIKRHGHTRAIIMGFEHEAMHQETLMYMAANAVTRKQTGAEKERGKDPETTVDLALKHPLDFQSPLHQGAEKNAEKDRIIRIPSGTVALGLNENDHATRGFAWDNEMPQHIVHVDAFFASSVPVTNGDFASFVNDGGYTRPEFWGDFHDFLKTDGSPVTAPVSWRPVAAAGFAVSTLFDGEHKIDEKPARDWPVQLSLAEAQAYCAWHGQGARIMTEAEYHLIFSAENRSAEAFGRAAQEGNNNWKFRGVLPVGSLADGQETRGVLDLVGNGWEWTSSAFRPFPGFAPMPEYTEYSQDFFGSSHFVLKGASPFTHRLLCRPSLRNWFQARYPYVWGKFRLCYDD